MKIRATTPLSTAYSRLLIVKPLLMCMMIAPVFTGCAPLILGGAAVGTLVATDRRTAGIQLEDQRIQFKAEQHINKALNERGHINANSYNRVVLLTGEVNNEADRSLAQTVAQKVENVSSVVNELAILGNSSVGSRSSDVLIKSKVKATLLNAPDLQSNAFEIVVERGTVYLLGIVTTGEAHRGVALSRSVPGVQKVVNLLTLVSESELARLKGPPASSTPRK